jgi:hypothetical protein
MGQHDRKTEHVRAKQPAVALADPRDFPLGNLRSHRSLPLDSDETRAPSPTKRKDDPERLPIRMTGDGTTDF